MPAIHRDSSIDVNGTTIAIREFDGEGRPLLLLHGGGVNLASWGGVVWGGLVRWLQPFFRLIAMDLRGHGQSSPANHFSFEEANDDIDATITALGLDNPYVVGHSFGGMIATHYGLRHPDCPGIVNVDGVMIRPEDHVGMSPQQVRELIERWRVEATPRLDWTGTSAELEERLRSERERFEAAGANWELASAEFRRGYVLGDDGLFHSNPGPALSREIGEAILNADMIGAYSRIRCPLLMVAATWKGEKIEEWKMELIQARIAGWRTGMERLQATQDNVHIEWLECGHAIPSTHGRELADLIKAYAGKWR